MQRRWVCLCLLIAGIIAFLNGCAAYCKTYDSFHHEVAEPAHSNYVGNVK